MRRVVVTGLGAVTPVGNTARSTWEALIAGRSGIGVIQRWDPSDLSIRIAGEVKDFQTDGVIPPKEARHMDRCVQMAVVAAREAVEDARLEITEENADQVGVVFGSGAGGVEVLLEQHRILLERGPDRVSPFFLPHMLPDSASGALAILLGAQGPNIAVVSACATGGHAVGEAMETIRRGDCEVIIAGGTEAPILPVVMAGFINMRALADENDDPEGACKPFDARRNGFVISEGAGALILEELEHARSRGARIYAEVIGYGSNNDGYHMAAPRPGGEGAIKTMAMALRKADIDPVEVNYINPHGTGTPLNDKYETAAIKTVFGPHAYDLLVSSTKSMVGHMMGGAGAIESIACVKAIADSIVPPTINYQCPDPECDLNYVPNTAQRADVKVAMSNSFGLGGHNSCVIFRKVE